MSSSSTIVLITGANTGLGFETVKSLLREYSSKTYTILLGGRSIDKANAAIKQIESEFPSTKSTLKAVQIDLEDDDSISRLAQQVTSEYGVLDVLINNGGAAFDNDLASGRLGVREMWNKSWNVNTVGTHILTHAMAPLLIKSSNPRLIFITSGTSTLTECGANDLFINKSPPKGWPKTMPTITAYRSSKTGMNMMMREWNRMLREDNVKVWGVSPGFLATGVGGDAEKNKKMGAIDPVIGADFVASVVEGARDHETGKVIRKDAVQPY